MNKCYTILLFLCLGVIISSCTSEANTSSNTTKNTIKTTQAPIPTSTPLPHPYYGATIQTFLDWYKKPADDLWKQGIRYDFRTNSNHIFLVVDVNGGPGPHDANIVWLMPDSNNVNGPL